MGPLTGLRVLDFSRVVAGPHATRMFVDMGADVIKVEPPEGDLTRTTTPRSKGMATYFVQQNVGKRNISLDLRQPRAVELLRALATTCDVVIENFRPGVLDRLGLGADVLMADNPRLVYGSVSGYGLDGPWVERRAYAPVVAAEVGFTKSQGDIRGGDYMNDRHSHADVYSAAELAAAVLAALYQRERTGRGQRVDVSLAETLLYVNEHVHNDLYDGDVDPNAVRSFGPSNHPVVELADGSMAIIAAHPAERHAFGAFQQLMGRPELADDPRFGSIADRIEHMPELASIIREWARTVPDVQQLEALFAPHSLAVGSLRSVREIADSDWAAARNAIVEVPDRSGGTVRIPNSPWRFSDAEAGAHGVPRYRGEDNREVLSGILGLSDGELDQLEQDGVLSSRLPAGLR